MSFFNKKEEVLEIELTQYGKHLLSKGEFVPVYAPDPALGEGDVDVFDSGEAPPPAFGEGNS